MEHALVEEILRCLAERPRRLPCKLFYDLEGSRLFDAICEQPEYYLTRAEAEILEREAAALAEALGEGVTLVELGSGSSTKTRLLLQALRRPAAYVPVDISGEHLAASAEALQAELPGLPIRPLVADYSRGMPSLAGLDLPQGRVVTFFSGSSIGNFEPGDAIAFMGAAAAIGGPSGRLLIAADLRKDPATLEAAYDDAAGITAAFNRNILVRIARELDGELDVDAFRHRARYNAEAGRVEMHLVSEQAQRIRIGDRSFALAAGEAIVTEHCYKYTVDGFAEMGRLAGLSRRGLWLDAAARFSLHLFARAQGAGRA